jgi:Holliday junction resolvasome RuvABC endonuclease subunit
MTGIAHMLGHLHGLERRELTASEIKRRVAGSGKASKGDVIAAVCNDGWAPDTDHAADAAALIIAWRAREVDQTLRPIEAPERQRAR